MNEKPEMWRRRLRRHGISIVDGNMNPHAGMIIRK